MKQVNDPHKQVMACQHGYSRVASMCKTSGKAWSLGCRFFARLRSDDKGQNLVELALLAPVLLLLVTGVFSIGMGMIVYEQLGEAAFAGDQSMSQFEGVTGTDLCGKAYTAVATVLSAPSWSAANLAKVKFSATLGNGGTTTTIPQSSGSFSCSGNLGNLGPKGQVTLRLSYDYTWMPIFGANLGTITIVRQQSVLAQ